MTDGKPVDLLPLPLFPLLPNRLQVLPGSTGRRPVYHALSYPYGINDRRRVTVSMRTRIIHVHAAGNEVKRYYNYLN